jgi:hypothetical protein
MAKNKRFRKIVKYDLEGFYKRWGFEYETIKNPSPLDIFFFPFILLLVSTIAIIFYPYYLFLNIREYRQVFFEEQK